MVTPASARTKVLLNGHSYTVARGKNGERLWSVLPRPSQPGDPGGIAFRDWTPWGHDLTSRATGDQYLGREYGDTTDGRNDNVDTIGPEMTTVTLSTYDGAAHTAKLLGSTFILGSATGLLGGAVAIADADGFASMKAGGVTYGYITRGQIPAKIRLSNMSLGIAGLATTAPATDIIHTRAALASTKNEVSIAIGDNANWWTLNEFGVSTSDSWSQSTQPAKTFGAAPSTTVVMSDRTIKQNILTGSVTMLAPNLATVSTIQNDDVTFTGFAMDGNLWIVMTDKGPLFVDDDTGEFTPIIPEIADSASTENGRQATNWFPIGTVIPLREGTRYQKALNGQSWGVERFLGNSSPVQGYPTGGDGSLKWFVQAVLNPLSTNVWIVAWRPRQPGDQHPYPLSPYVIGNGPHSSRFVAYVGYANGERTMPAWIIGNESDISYWVDGRTSRFIDDTSYRYNTSGATYLTELYLDGVIADIEAVEVMTAKCTASRNVTVSLSTDGGSNYTQVGAAITTNGFHRQVAASGSPVAPDITGAYRIKPKLSYATSSATNAPQVISKVRVYWRWRPLTVNEYTWTLDLTDSTVGNAEEQQDQLISAWGAGPVLVTEDLDNDSYTVRVNSVTVHEVQDAGGGTASGSSRGTRRYAEVTAVSWPTS